MQIMMKELFTVQVYHGLRGVWVSFIIVRGSLNKKGHVVQLSGEEERGCRKRVKRVKFSGPTDR